MNNQDLELKANQFLIVADEIAVLSLMKYKSKLSQTRAFAIARKPRQGEKGALIN